jgi:phage recombination protein Bet
LTALVLHDGAGLNEERVALIKRTICKGASDDELTMFVETAKRLQLDPFARQVFAVKRWDSREKREVMAIQVSIDGFRLVAERTGKYAGQLGPLWTADGKEWVEVWLNKTPPAAAKVAVLRSDFKEPLWGVATWEQYKQTGRDGGLTPMWSRMGPLMLAKCAESLALRRAFPNELSGVYTQEEMAQATVVEVEPSADPKAVGSANTAAGSTPSTSAAGKTAAGPTTATSDLPSADKVKHDGNLITDAQLKKLHIMRREAGGSYCTDEGDDKSLWRMKVLGVYRDPEGNRLTSSKQLSRDQASHLIERLTRYMARTNARAEQQPDIGARPPANDVTLLRSQIDKYGIPSEDVTERILAPWGVDTVEQLDPEDRPKALQLLMAYVEGFDAYVRMLGKLGFPTESVQ